MSERPDPPEARPGFRAVATTEDRLTWRFSTRGLLCRMTGCPNPAVVELNRGRRTAHGRVDVWWTYCSDHMYGRWIENGRIMHWRLVAQEPTDE